MFSVTPLSDSMQNFSLDLELFPVSLETLSFLFSHIEVLTESTNVGESEFSRQSVGDSQCLLKGNLEFENNSSL